MREFIIEKGVLKKYRGNAADVTIPEGVTAIGEGAVSIGEGAFDGCYSLTCAMIPDSVQSIGKGAFWGCFSVTLHVSSGSYAETYAMQEGLRYTLR